jgi:phage anti-repressor protein
MTHDADSDNVVTLDTAREAKMLERKEERVAKMARRFEAALPNKATPVKDYLKKKRKAKKKK